MCKKLYCFHLVWKFFRQGWGFVDSFEMARRWFQVKNSLLGGVAPCHMIDAGRTDRLLKFIKMQLSQNKRKV